MAILSQMWSKYLPLPTFTYDKFNTPNLGNHSPYELEFGRKPRSLLNLDSTLDIKVSGTFKQCYDLLNKRLKYLHNLLLNFKSKRLAMIKKIDTGKSLSTIKKLVLFLRKSTNLH